MIATVQQELRQQNHARSIEEIKKVSVNTARQFTFVGIIRMLTVRYSCGRNRTWERVDLSLEEMETIRTKARSKVQISF